MLSYEVLGNQVDLRTRVDKGCEGALTLDDERLRLSEDQRLRLYLSFLLRFRDCRGAWSFFVVTAFMGVKFGLSF